ncbi:MAG: hypothetical protein WBA07_26280 [Rivularia sp. (in: cyanobacteria)]
MPRNKTIADEEILNVARSHFLKQGGESFDKDFSFSGQRVDVDRSRLKDYVEYWGNSLRGT